MKNDSIEVKQNTQRRSNFTDIPITSQNLKNIGDLESINKSIDNVIQSYEKIRKKEVDDKYQENRQPIKHKRRSFSRFESPSYKYHRNRHHSKSRSNRSSVSNRRNNRSRSSSKSKGSRRKRRHKHKSKKDKKIRSKNKNYSSRSESEESSRNRERSRSRSISYNSFKKRKRRENNKRSVSSSKKGSFEKEGYVSESSFDSEKFENKLKKLRDEKLNRSNQERRIKHADNKEKGKYVFNKSLLSNIIQENMRNNKRADLEEMERATKKLYEIDQEAFNQNKKAKLMSTFINEPKQVLDKEDMTYEIVDGEFKPVYKPCVCIYKNCGKRFVDSFELSKHMKTHLE